VLSSHPSSAPSVAGRSIVPSPGAPEANGIRRPRRGLHAAGPGTPWSCTGGTPPERRDRMYIGIGTVLVILLIVLLLVFVF